MSGIKIHITVDILGLPHAIHVTCANVTDRAGALEMISLNLDNLSAVETIIFLLTADIPEKILPIREGHSRRNS